MAENGTNRGITKITVSGFKSLRDESSIDVRPLTILAGANSSGKSSIMQPLLLLKQTLEATFDPVTFLLDGSNVRFTNDEQFLNIKAKDQAGDYLLTFHIEMNEYEALRVWYKKFAENLDFPLVPVGTAYISDEGRVSLFIGQTSEEIIQELGKEIEALRIATQHISKAENISWRTVPSRGFISVALHADQETVLDFGDVSLKVFPVGEFKTLIRDLIHVPGLRGNPRREYHVAATDTTRFEGTFDNYVASLINQWQSNNDDRLSQVTQILSALGLTSRIASKPLNDAQIELRVGRTLTSNESDLVSIADVGFGVSQVLPVLVALLVAEPGQLVYIEQPELHLHPRAQVALASVLADAAKRGVRVVAETHSSLLLLGIQTLIAKGELAPETTILHWFTRSDEGVTTINSVVPDENGAYGDWPVDFDDVELHTQKQYLDAVAEREMGM